MVETIANSIIWLVKTVCSDGFGTFVSMIAIFIVIIGIVTVIINRSKDHDGKIDDAKQIGSSILILIVAALILSITLR